MSTQSTLIPLRGPVLGSLLMAFAWGVIAGCVGLNALIKSNQAKSHLRSLVPANTVVNINDNDAFTSGVVLTTVGALIAVLCAIFSFMQIFTKRLAVRSLRIQSFLLAFCSAWLFATLVPFTDFFANRSAKVTAFIGGIQLPDSIVKQTEVAMGQTSVYRNMSYLKLVAILPWITLLFTIIASVVIFISGSRASRASSTFAAAVENNPDPIDEKYEKHDEVSVAAVA